MTERTVRVSPQIPVTPIIKHEHLKATTLERKGHTLSLARARRRENICGWRWIVTGLEVPVEIARIFKIAVVFFGDLRSALIFLLHRRTVGSPRTPPVPNFMV